MIRDNRTLRRAGAATALTRIGATALCILAATPALTAASADAARIVYEPVSETVFLHELHTGQVSSASINKREGLVHATLKDGSHVRFKYHKHQEPHARAEIAAAGVPVAVLTEAQAKAEIAEIPVHHKLRYIAAAIIVVVVVVVAAVLLLYRRRRRRQEEEEYGPRNRSASEPG
jgi:hypothetical protein